MYVFSIKLSMAVFVSATHLNLASIFNLKAMRQGVRTHSLITQILTETLPRHNKNVLTIFE